MRYENLKTGAIIDSSLKIFGGDWVLSTDKNINKTPEKQNEEQLDKTKDQQIQEETLEEENLVDFDGITRVQIMQELDAFGIEYDKRANKQILYDLMLNHGQ